MTEKRPRTTTMNKRELMLLEKQLAFRTVKDSQRPSTGSFFTRSPSKNSFSQGSRDNNTSFTLPSITSSPSPSSSSQSPQKHSTMIDQELIATLSTKPISLRRKMQMKRKKNPAFDSQPDLLSLKPDTSYMKKGEKIDPTRHDGMTLSELYHFKKNDAWKNVRVDTVQYLHTSSISLTYYASNLPTSPLPMMNDTCGSLCLVPITRFSKGKPKRTRCVKC